MYCLLLMLIFFLFCQNSQSANPINDNIVFMNNQSQNPDAEVETPNMQGIFKGHLHCDFYI